MGRRPRSRTSPSKTMTTSAFLNVCPTKACSLAGSMMNGNGLNFLFCFDIQSRSQPRSYSHSCYKTKDSYFVTLKEHAVLHNMSGFLYLISKGFHRKQVATSRKRWQTRCGESLGTLVLELHAITHRDICREHFDDLD